jgi:hypothetical protein
VDTDQCTPADPEHLPAAGSDHLDTPDTVRCRHLPTAATDDGARQLLRPRVGHPFCHASSSAHHKEHERCGHQDNYDDERRHPRRLGRRRSVPACAPSPYPAESMSVRRGHDANCPRPRDVTRVNRRVFRALVHLVRTRQRRSRPEHKQEPPKQVRFRERRPYLLSLLPRLRDRGRRNQISTLPRPFPPPAAPAG